MAIDLIHCVERYRTVNDPRASTAKRMLKDVEQWLREEHQLDIADKLKRILEEIDG